MSDYRESGNLTIRDFSLANFKRCDNHFHGSIGWSHTDWACALAGEVGEACNLIKKMRRGEDIDREEVRKELADVITYADLLMRSLGGDTATELRKKFNEVSDRVGSDIKI